MSDGAASNTPAPVAPRADARLAALYQELLLDHYRRPRNKGVLDPADVATTLKNPLCGDEIELRLAFEGDRVRDARWTGQGCAVSTASASMMTQLIAGKTAGEALAARDQVARMMNGDATAAADPALGDLRALAGVARLPVRVKCAMLPWAALARALAGRT
ncbi:MAG: Fe-S cluster assembly sulfur transfer protein SufU [Gemmatimonadaceae bacterium]